MIQDNQQILALVWGRDKFANGIAGHKPQGSENMEKVYGLVVSAKGYPVFGICYATPYRSVAVYRHGWSLERTMEKIVKPPTSTQS